MLDRLLQPATRVQAAVDVLLCAGSWANYAGGGTGQFVHVPKETIEKKPIGAVQEAASLAMVKVKALQLSRGHTAMLVDTAELSDLSAVAPLLRDSLVQKLTDHGVQQQLTAYGALVLCGVNGFGLHTAPDTLALKDWPKKKPLTAAEAP